MNCKECNEEMYPISKREMEEDGNEITFTQKFACSGCGAKVESKEVYILQDVYNEPIEDELKPSKTMLNSISGTMVRMMIERAERNMR